MSNTLTVHYHRPPDRVDIYEQEILYADEAVLVSYLKSARIRQPMLIAGEVAIEPGSPLIWFTFPKAMHDVALFHTAAGEFTGWYADILEPVELARGNDLSLTDLFLDIWIGRDGAATILDEAELSEAVAKGWVTTDTAAAAWSEANRLLALHALGEWPPAIVNEWSLARVRAILEV